MAAASSLLGASSSSLALTPKIASSKNGVFASELLAFAPLKGQLVKRRSGAKVVSMAAIPADRVPDMGKRVLMNYLLFGAMTLPTIAILGPYLYFFVPPSSVSGGAGLVARDALGIDITAAKWVRTHPPGDRTLSEGLKGDPTYLVMENDGTLATYGINAVCTHLGCVVPWNPAENKFICPCHGSQYTNQGRVVRGPAPLSLALAHVDVVDDLVTFTPWVETDFRTGDDPWWA